MSENTINEQNAILPYYVYELRDPRDNRTFYVGKGSSLRIYAHSADEENQKGARINEINKLEMKEQRIIIGRFETEEEAFAVESILIKWVYGFDNLTNRVHGHRQVNIRPHSEQISGNYSIISGIDVSRDASSNSGEYTSNQKSQLIHNSVFEKLIAIQHSLRDDYYFHDLTINDPDIRTPADPHILITGFSSAVQIMVKLQLTGKTAVLNLVPTDTSMLGLTSFENLLKTRRQPYRVNKGAGRFKRYSQTHDFKTKAGGFPGGIPCEDIPTLMQLIKDTIIRLNN